MCYSQKKKCFKPWSDYQIFIKLFDQTSVMIGVLSHFDSLMCHQSNDNFSLITD